MSEEILVCLILAMMFVAQVSRRVSPTVGVTGALAGLYLVGVLDASEALSGFSNPAPFSIAGLYVVARAVERAGGLHTLTRRILGSGAPVGHRAGLFRLTASAGVMSSFLANTPVVAMLISPISSWAKRRHQSPGRYLIPLSYAAILGGMPTLIGTSTNLVASGIVHESGQDPYSLFEPARMGLPVALAGFILILLLSSRVLPDRGAADESEPERAFSLAMRVAEQGSVDGLTVVDAGLRQLGKVYLVGVRRQSNWITPVDPEFVLRGGDQLTFAGNAQDVVALQQMAGLELLENKHVVALDDRQHSWFEAVLGGGSPVIGRTMKQVNFRSRYQAAVLAIHRSGQLIEGNLGETRLQLGDCLLLVADGDFGGRWSGRSDFLLVRRRREAPPQTGASARVSLFILAAVAILPMVGVSVMRSALLGAVAMVASGVVTPRQARDSVDLNVVLMVASAIGIGVAVEISGLAARLADLVLDMSSWAGTWGAAFGLVAISLLLTELMTNTGAIAMMIPIALRVADMTAADSRVFVLGVTVAASASFLTPVGYQTNTMVYGPGRYRFTDYLRLGLPMTAMTLVLVPLMMAWGRGIW